MDQVPLLHRCWGKAQGDKPGEWHPALLHMLDVAAVALELLCGETATQLADDLRRPAPGLLLSDSAVALLVACHDLGKVSPGFQRKVGPLAEPLVEAGLPFPELADRDHGSATQAALPDILEALGVGEDASFVVAQAVAAHHGRFHAHVPPSRRRRDPGGGQWPALRRLAVAQLARCLGAQPPALDGLSVARDGWLMRLAGLTTVADWIGSDCTYFPYEPGAVATPAYLAAARHKARRALDHLGWTGWCVAGPPRPFRQLFDFEPTPLQRAVEVVAQAAEAPSLVIIEAPTGVGKTEAALTVCEQWIGRFGLGGAYYALPTTATSNQMFGRLRRFLAGRYGEQRVNLHLAHGLRGLNDDYRTLRPRSVGGQDGAGQAVVADEWFRSRKRTLLSPFAVGTVDQAMLAALQCRHFFVRQFGLARKVVVIDEVHGYDAFMSRILDRLLTWLRELGSGVVLLSATLPRARRAELIEAWGGRRPAGAPPSYPRLAAIAADGTLTEQATPAGPPRRVELVTPPEDTQGVAASLLEAVGDGGCAAWICNTVGAAQAAYASLLSAAPQGCELMLFHARFPLDERLGAEAQVLARFSKDADRPACAIVVATQVVEQSLDLDFDLMVSELAPIDLLLQRAGRLHRHRRSRPEAHCRPRLWVRQPSHGQGPPEFGASGFVYDPHILLRTWWVLRGRGRLVSPGDLDGLMAEVYGDDASPPADMPADIAARWSETRAELDRALTIARGLPAQTMVPPPGDGDGFAEGLRFELVESDDAPDLHPTLRARTRDIEDSITIVCLHQAGDGVEVSPTEATPVDLEAPPCRTLARRLLRRSVSLQHRGWIGRLRSLDPPSGWRRDSLLRHARAVVFDGAGMAQIADRRLLLDPRLGLVLDPPEGL